VNILHINVADEARGAAQAAFRLHEAQLGLGHSSHMLVGYRFKDRPDIEMLPPRRTRWQKRLHRFVNRLEELTGQQYLWQPWRKDFLSHRFTREADVVNLHNTHGGYFSHRVLPELTRRLPVVWTLHDLWGMTGHCGSPYMHDCERWKSGCGKCPSLSDHPALAIDTTAWLWRIKASLYRRSDLVLTTPSEWVAAMVRQSPLLQRFEVRCIPHGLDTEVFKPTARQAARDALGIPAAAKVVLFAAFDLFQQRKGGVYLFDALQRLADEGRKDLLLVTVGCERAELPSRYRFARQNLGLVRDERRLAQCFSAADLYVGPSLAETFGLVYMEAMACATPVVAFDCTAVGEVVRHGETGYLARNRDLDDLTHGIRALLDDDARREALGRRSREVVEREYTLDLQARRYVELYQSAIDGQAARAAGPRNPLLTADA
jgi:glycosyltransferase involved in cell wall biosynthesis